MKLTASAVLMMLLTLYAPISHGREVAGIEIEESIQISGNTLALNGSGIRKKFFFKIYVGSLYCKNRSGNLSEIINNGGPYRVSMHILYDEISAKKLNAGWADGFDENLTPEEKAALKPTIETFYTLFKTVHEGDVIDIDMSKNGITSVSINGSSQGSVNSPLFPQALLKIWLGDAPADNGLKRDMLGS